MKKEFLKKVKAVLVPVALTVAMAVFSPMAALAEGHGGAHGFSGGHGGYGEGHSFAAPRGNFGGGHSGGAYYGGRGYYGGGGYYASRGYYGGRGYRPGFGFGFYAPYGYAPPVCNPGGFYDQYGVWRVYPGCAAPYGY